jgi:hypothetical protein
MQARISRCPIRFCPLDGSGCCSAECDRKLRKRSYADRHPFVRDANAGLIPSRDFGTGIHPKHNLFSLQDRLASKLSASLLHLRPASSIGMGLRLEVRRISRASCRSSENSTLQPACLADCRTSACQRRTISLSVNRQWLQTGGIFPLHPCVPKLELDLAETSPTARGSTRCPVDSAKDRMWTSESDSCLAVGLQTTAPPNLGI